MIDRTILKIIAQRAKVYGDITEALYEFRDIYYRFTVNAVLTNNNAAAQYYAEVANYLSNLYFRALVMQSKKASIKLSQLLAKD